MSGDIGYICFTEAERPVWWMRWLKKGFSHCFILIPHNGLWVKYEHGHGVTRIDIVDNVTDIVERCTIVKYEFSGKRSGLMILSCVGFVKAVAGISGLSLTPYQLYRRISSGFF